MSFSLIFHPRAEKELNDVIDFYNVFREDLGLEAYNEIVDYIETLKDFPFVASKRYGEVRIFFTKKFHFGIHYIALEEFSEVIIIAIVNAKQEIKAQQIFNRISDMEK
ncbi:type II toxin-antitoxin system RelE/ParE family toxin [Capnocytophaga periodontitidis]|uniref:type II toxin-antitoxin system RelE/ParE family toxin n=1 Tax=Capnocytophaga periodontitidis TaxID=2795027 RepID=UPI0018E176EF|nr:type II toxin-antitoxin system RelE/ParE family toxin [Capnocytophaga periodontitidis]MBI1667956.1 type II toxin-antitoxin system RelE/ParE family toxin [Capnocytophaga periodontitidis]